MLIDFVIDMTFLFCQILQADIPIIQDSRKNYLKKEPAYRLPSALLHVSSG